MVDFHSHLVPGVDDGARSVEESLEALGRLGEAGIRTVVTTPHLQGSLTREPGVFETRMAELDAGWEKVRAAVVERLPEVDLRRGHEVMLDTPDPDFSDERLRLAGGPFVLVEWPRLRMPPGTPEVVERIHASGWHPVIAHAERYFGPNEPVELAVEWKTAGALLQVNYGALAGRYGRGPRATGLRLLRRGLVSYLATDFHGRSHQALHIAEARRVLLEAGGEEQWELLCRINPSRLLQEDHPIPVPALALDAGVWGRLRNLFSAGT